MVATAKENFANYFVNISYSTASHPFSKLTEFVNFGEKQPGRKDNLNVYIVAVLLILIIIKYVSVKKRHKRGYISYSDTLPYLYWIPYVKFPLLEGIVFWYGLRKDGLQFIESIVEKYGRNGTFSLGFKTAVAVSDPVVIQKLLSSTNPGHLNKSQFLYSHMFTRLMKDGLVAAKVDTWSSHRKIVSPAFKYKAFTTYFKLIYDGAKELAQSASNAAAKTSNGVLCNETMKTFIDYHAVNIVTRIIMGSDSFTFSDQERISFHESFKRWKEITVERFHRPEQVIPMIWWFHPNKKHLNQAIENIETISYKIIDNYRMKAINGEGGNQNEVKGTVSSHSDSQSFPEQVLKINKEAEDIGIKPFECLVELMIKSGLSNKEITDEVATFLGAGHETVKVALDMLIFQLAGNPEHQEKCRIEVDKLFKCGDGESNLKLDDFSKLKYLEMCILESLRLTPTVPAILRDLQEPLKIDEHCVIPVGEYVLVLPWILHRNPEIYPNPEKFDPNRFLPENVKQRHPYSFIPFSSGMRNCIGYKVALLELKVIMAWILRYFEVHTTDGPNDVKMFFDVTLKPERPYSVTFTPRVMQLNNQAN